MQNHWGQTNGNQAPSNLLSNIVKSYPLQNGKEEEDVLQLH